MNAINTMAYLRQFHQLRVKMTIKTLDCEISLHFHIPMAKYSTFIYKVCKENA